MSKIEITPEILERFKARFKHHCLAFGAIHWTDLDQALDEAFNPPKEPEIVVTEVMLAAAHTAMDASYLSRDPAQDNARKILYRAMRKLEPSAAPTSRHAACELRGCLMREMTTGTKRLDNCSLPIMPGVHRRSCDSPDFPHLHKRKDDPK